MFKAKTVLILICIFFVGCSPEDGMDGNNGINGENGTNGLTSLLRTIIEQPGDNCSNGGYKIETGLDNSRNGVLDANEITGVEYICNPENSNSNYESYVSLISQTDDENPTSTIVENTLNLDIVWTRESQGKYVGDLSSSINISKTVIFYTTPNTHTGVRGELVGDNQVRIELQNGINVFQDNFSNLSFELRQYE